jgi:hypothetical protein
MTPEQKTLIEAEAKRRYTWYGGNDSNQMIFTKGAQFALSIANQWIRIEPGCKMPEAGMPVSGFHVEWVDEDFNPTGACKSHVDQDGAWTSEQWDSDQDSYHTHSLFWCGEKAEKPFTPTHWQPLPLPPTQ